MAKHEQSFYEAYSDDLLTYNARDCVYTARIYEKLIREPRWREPRTKKLYDIHVQLSKLAARMHTHGFWVHEQNRAFMIWAFEREYREKERHFLRLVNIDGMRCNGNDLRSLIYKRHSRLPISRFNLPDPFDPRMFTDETMETISVDRASLLLLLAEGDCPPGLVPIIDAYWAAESAWKSRTFLVSKKTTQAIGRDGYLRPSWNSCGTDTMRFSCRDPNIMQWEKEIRCMLGAPPGRLLVGMDKSQLEIRMGEIIAKDDFLWNLIQTGDVYSADVRDALGIPVGEPCDKKSHPRERQDFKIIRLASQYMAGLPTVYSQYLQSDRNVSFNKVKLLYSRFHRVHADGLVRYAHDALEQINQRGYSEGKLLHGRRYYPRSPPITEAANWEIQRTASEQMNIETLRFDRELRKVLPNAAIVAQMHDAVIVDCAEKDAKTVRKLMRTHFNTSYTIDGRTRPFPIEIKTGHTWDEV